MERWRNCVAVVTGASSGIGADITKSLLQAGLRVVGLARRDHLINEMRNTLPAELQKNLYALKCDVSVRDSVNKCFDWIEENLGGVDVLINNAAIFKSGELLTMDINSIESAVATNILGFVYCVRRAANSMKSRKVAGHIVFVNSVVGHYLINALPDSKPAFNIYPCTKHATVVMTEILRQELRFSQTNIKITVSTLQYLTNLYLYFIANHST